MKLLFCVEFYFPSLGGAQEVVRQLAERMVARGHQVTVATSKLISRTLSNHNGVTIKEFSVSGNRVRGLLGDVDIYQKFLTESDFDIVFFYAAQQWTFDAAWSVLTSIQAKKILVPCGYSGLFEPGYSEYFRELPSILSHLDRVVYHATSYRDYEFGVQHSIAHCAVIPNGADDLEFLAPKMPEFKSQLGVPNDALLLLTVGSLNGQKGHLELTRAFDLASFGGRKAVLLLNGNTPASGQVSSNRLRRFFSLASEYGWSYAARHVAKSVLELLGFEIGKSSSLLHWVKRVNNRVGEEKRVILCDLSRPDLVQAYLHADLFVFASNVEYSPLVLFEACAAGLPFLSVPAGNAVEIASWTGGGEICPADVDSLGYTRVAPAVLARNIEALIADEGRRLQLGRSGRQAWETRYNWKQLSQEYEALFVRLIGDTPVSLLPSIRSSGVGSEVGVALE